MYPFLRVIKRLMLIKIVLNVYNLFHRLSVQELYFGSTLMSINSTLHKLAFLEE